ncbi:NAD dependent epimerase/dehydratase family/3-beta hydroxysteroid dehydrogenase/isomerase family/NAD(P)H-binding, putative [Leishmania lindenbergi]|uniref:NAD dependent epimerase/dehydratase family/3-beta hydroxysteroid dehydrogenase n=1 Tax=Leishmania lindenbergi TaxID=651832 RepID=A0AAW3B225_9TRYP
MFRVFSGSCMSLEDMDTVLRSNLVEHPHLLGPGADFFTESGEPVRPQPGAHTFQKVFSGSALDLNANNAEGSDEEVAASSSLGQGPRAIPPSSILNQISTENEKEKARAAKMKIHVLVIGESGYLASHVIAKLLDAGYSVRMTVPDAARQQKQIDLYGASRDVAQRLTILQADITNSNTLRDAIRGCRYIVHCGCSSASPQAKDLVTFYTKAIRALFDGIRLSGKSTVKRVVLTGSASSIVHITECDPPSGLFDENNWNSVATPEDDPLPYAKLVFEREAWRLRQMMGVELVVLLPSISIGPSLTDETSEAMVTIEGLANSSKYFPFCPNLSWNFVDVRDVADAHVRAMEVAEVRDQRIIISNECVSLPELCRTMKQLCPQLTPPTHTAWTVVTLGIATLVLWNSVNLRFLWRSLGVRKRLNNRRAKEQLGITFTPMQQTLRDCLEQMTRSAKVTADAEAAAAAQRSPANGRRKSKVAPSSSRLVSPTVMFSLLTLAAAGATVVHYLKRK